MIDWILKIRGTTVLRIGVALVFIWFGTQQLLQADRWLGFIPQDVLDIAPVGATTLVHLNGALEVVFGFSLLFGLFTRISALILGLHMADITFIVGYTDIGVRDFGLTIAGLAVFLNGADPLTLDNAFFLEPPEEPEKPPAAGITYLPSQFHPWGRR